MQPRTEITEIAVTYKPAKAKAAELFITSSEDAYQLLKTFFDTDTLALQEQFLVAYLNRANKVIGVYEASKGGITGTVADPRLILAVALKVAASGIILAHNHPSGSLRASVSDQDLTIKIAEAAKLHDIKLLDHLILNGDDEYLSFADEGIL